VSEFFGILMLDDNDGSRRAQCHGLPASLLAHIERKTEAVWKSIDELQKAMEEFPPAQRSGPEMGFLSGSPQQPLQTSTHTDRMDTPRGRGLQCQGSATLRSS
jgi:hypothetical protein